MTTPRSTRTAGDSLARELFSAGRYYLGGRRGLLIAAGLVLLAGLALNWSWLVAAGIAPILIAVVPCLAMCALGLCMNKRSGDSSDPAAINREPSPATDEAVPSTQAATFESVRDSSPGEPPRSEGGTPLTTPEPQPSQERSTTDA